MRTPAPSRELPAAMWGALESLLPVDGPSGCPHSAAKFATRQGCAPQQDALQIGCRRVSPGEAPDYRSNCSANSALLITLPARIAA